MSDDFADLFLELVRQLLARVNLALDLSLQGRAGNKPSSASTY